MYWQLNFELFSGDLPSIEKWRAHFESAQHSSCNIDRALRDTEHPHSDFIGQILFAAIALLICNLSIDESGQSICFAARMKCLHRWYSVWFHCLLRKSLCFNCTVCRQSRVALENELKLFFSCDIDDISNEGLRNFHEVHRAYKMVSGRLNFPIENLVRSQKPYRTCPFSSIEKKQRSEDGIAGMN